MDLLEKIADEAISEYERLHRERSIRLSRDAWLNTDNPVGVGQPPYGSRWRRVLILEDDPYEQGVLGLFHEMFAAGLSNQQVADALNALGYLSRQGNPFTAGPVSYQRHKLGYESWTSPPRPPRPPCSVEGCDRESEARDWCGLHYNRFKRSGTLDDPQPKTHCPQGHPYEGDNLKVYGGKRVCAECNRAKVRRFYKRHPEKKHAERRKKHELES